MSSSLASAALVAPVWSASAPLHTEADTLIRALYTGKVGWSGKERAQSAKTGAVFATLRHDAEATHALCRLLYGSPGNIGLATVEPLHEGSGPQAGNTGLDALLHLSRHHERWRRAPEDWQPEPQGSPLTHLCSLAAHLLLDYAVPDFFTQAWLLGMTSEAETYREWYLHLGQGGHLEQIRFPVPMTHRAAHHFLHAPAFFSFPSALRWGQIKALNSSDGSDRSEDLAQTVAQTFLANQQYDEAFWFTFVQFLVNHPELSLWQVGPVADFIRVRRGDKNDGPEPSFSLKGRTVTSLLTRMDEWHESLQRLGKSRQNWEPSGIEDWERVGPDVLGTGTCTWRIVEVREGLHLLEEGREMRHCVRSYQEACVKGTSAIFSVRCVLAASPGLRRLLTVEVNLSRRAIVQVRGKCNQTIGSMRGNRRILLARDELKAWARTQRLSIACAL